MLWSQAVYTTAFIVPGDNTEDPLCQAPARFAPHTGANGSKIADGDEGAGRDLRSGGYITQMLEA